MKKKLKHSSVQRLYWKKAQKRWRAKHPERTKEIQKEYWKRKRMRLISEKEQQQKKAHAPRKVRRRNRKTKRERGI
jgi:hypothetical protein